MRGAGLADVDLNLLVALEVLLAESNVTAAARRLGRTQSAMSHALTRLRALLGDPLLVRTSRGMVATPRGEALRDEVTDLLARIERTVRAPSTFEPRTARRRFAVVQTDYTQTLLLPPLLEELRRIAPGVGIDVRAPGRDAERLEAGTIDLAVRVVKLDGPGIHVQRLFRDGFACLAREGHPLFDTELTAARFAELDHLLVSPGGGGEGVVDHALRRLGLERRIVLTTPNFLVAPFLVASSDLCLTLPSRFAEALAGMARVRVFEPPVSLAPTTVAQYWHERTANDPAHGWFRATVARIARARPEDTPEAAVRPARGASRQRDS